MKKILFILLCLSILTSFLTACQPELQPPGIEQSAQTTAPATTSAPAESHAQETGTLVTELLEIPGDLSRCNITSTSSFWEVEDGFYRHTPSMMLYYADKSDLSNWVPVCTKPDCPHIAVGVESTCDARADRVMIQGDRIYRLYEAEHPFTLLSTALDGTDLRTEFVFSDAVELMALGGSGNALMTTEYLVCYISALDAEGNYDFRVYTADENGVTMQMKESRDHMSVLIRPYDSGNGLWFNGPAIIDDMSRVVIYTLDGGELVSVELSGLPLSGSWFSGEDLLVFRPNDGYYRIDTTTREEIKLSEPQLTDSDADIALPNCIIESTLFYREQTVERHEMWLFNGQEWLEVAIPEELQTSENERYVVKNITVASDRLLLLVAAKGQQSGTPYALYQILLGSQELAMAYVGQVS